MNQNSKDYGANPHGLNNIYVKREVNKLNPYIHVNQNSKDYGANPHGLNNIYVRREVNKVGCGHSSGEC